MKALSFDEVAASADITRRTFERIIAAGEGPAIVHVSKRRRGVLEQDRDTWLMSRRRTAPGETSDTEAR